MYPAFKGVNMTDLIVLENLNKEDVFLKGKMQDLLNEIEKKATSQVFNVENKKDRDEIKSLAHKVARSKTTLDNMGKELALPWKEKVDKVTKSRKTATAFLDKLKVTVRQPLDEYEKREEERILKIKNKLREIENFQFVSTDNSSEFYKAQLASLESIEINEFFEEFKASAMSHYETSKLYLEKRIETAELREDQERRLAEFEARERELKLREEAVKAKEIKSNECRTEPVKNTEQLENEKKPANIGIEVSLEQALALFSLIMAADPSPINGDEQILVSKFADSIAKKFGHSNWIDCYLKNGNRDGK